MKQIDDTAPVSKPARRRFLAVAGTAELGATAAKLLAVGSAGAAEIKAKAKAPSGGAAVALNNALGLQWELIAAYRAFPGTGLLSKTAIGYTQTFLAHHQTHAERLTGAVKAAGGAPVQAKPAGSYAKSLNIAALKSAQDVMKLALRLEKASANAYLNMVANLTDPLLAQMIARLGADEAMHWGVIADALGTAMPPKAMSFGT